MKGKDSVHLRAFHTSRPNHPLCAPVALFVGLKEAFYVARQFLPVGAKQPGRPQQGGAVKVVAAGVHHTRPLRRPGQLRLLRDGKGIQLRPEGHRPASISAPEEGHHPRLRRTGDLQSQGGKTALNENGALPFVPPQLRILMEDAVDALHPGGESLCLLVKLLYGRCIFHRQAPFRFVKGREENCCFFCYFVSFENPFPIV